MSLLVSFSFGQENNLTESYIYKTFDGYFAEKPFATLHHQHGDVIRYAFPAGLETRLKTISDNCITFYKQGSIWGYKKKGALYRQYTNYKQRDLGWESCIYFKVIYNEEVVIYSVKHSGAPPAFTNYNSNYYSVDLNAAIKTITEKNLITDFYDKPEIIKRIIEKTTK
jgi:hypothetical protein